MYPLALAARQCQVAAPHQMPGIGSLQCRLDNRLIAFKTCSVWQAPHANHFFNPEGKTQT
ncbi:hypothetical protein D3C84_1140770 [compost metagenome]